MNDNPRAYPAALPSRGLGTKTADANLTAFGLVLGPLVPGDLRFREVTLPDGWAGIPDADSVWRRVVDQHGRTRVALRWEVHVDAWQPLTFVFEVHDYAQLAMWGIEPLVLDQQWATRTAVLAVMQPKLDRTADQARDIAESRLDNPYAAAELPLLIEEIHQFARFIETVKAAPEAAR